MSSLDKNDPMGSRLKAYESHETHRKAMLRLPICARMDGRAFHSFTKGLDRPYDYGFTRAMIETAKYLVNELRATIGYTQSDEITIILWNESFDAQIPFGGKLFKLTSILASMVTAKFISLLPEYIPSKVGKLPTFDARVFQVPSLDEAANVLLWRWFDARRNSISMAAQSVFSSEELHKKTAVDQIHMLRTKGIEWKDYPEFFRRGTFVRRETVYRELTEEELSQVPEQYRPSGPVARSRVNELKLPPLIDIENRVDVLLLGARPKVIHGDS